MNALQKNFMEKFDFNRFSQEWPNEENPEIGVITFDGGDTYEGWIHEIYSIYPNGKLTMQLWDSGGYENVDEDEEEIEYNSLKSRLLSGEIPLSKWTNKKGAKFCLQLLDEGIDIEKLRRRVRDVLNKSQDELQILRFAWAFGVKLN